MESYANPPGFLHFGMLADMNRLIRRPRYVCVAILHTAERHDIQPRLCFCLSVSLFAFLTDPSQKK